MAPLLSCSESSTVEKMHLLSFYSILEGMLKRAYDSELNSVNDWQTPDGFAVAYVKDQLTHYFI